MWVVAGVLLGLVVLAVVAGWHVGPHAHALAAVIGTLAAAWMIAMLAVGDARPLLYILLGTDVVVSAGVGYAGWRGLREPARSHSHLRALNGAMGVAVTDMAPDGIVRVNSETWSARSMNGSQPAGSPIQVIGVRGIRLEVWGEEAAVAPTPQPLTDHTPDAPAEPTTSNLENRSNAS